MRIDQVGTEQLQQLNQFTGRINQEAERIRTIRGSAQSANRAGLLALATARALHVEVEVLQYAHFMRTHGKPAYAEQLLQQYNQPLLPAQFMAHCAIMAQLAETDETATYYKEQAHLMAVRNGYLTDKH